MKTRKFFLLSLENTKEAGSRGLENLEPYVNSGKGYIIKDIFNSKKYFFYKDTDFNIVEIEIEGKPFYVHEKDGIILDV